MSITLDAPLKLPSLQEHLAANRFLPAPPPELMMCGDGDFRAVGAEFLGHFVSLADLAPGERVLDLGCGVGRMAIPLTQYMSDAGSYVGVDVSRDAIAWCAQIITPSYPAFQFTQLDIQHDLYNPGGKLDAASVRFPFPDASFDLICMISVLTHLGTGAVVNYAREISRLLAPGGRCFATAFLVNAPAREGLARGEARLPFDLTAQGGEYYADAEAPLGAVAFDEDHLLEKFLRYGLRRRRRPVYGHWSGRKSQAFQDINVFEGASDR